MFYGLEMLLLGFNEKIPTGGVWEQVDKEKYFNLKEVKNTCII